MKDFIYNKYFKFCFLEQKIFVKMLPQSKKHLLYQIICYAFIELSLLFVSIVTLLGGTYTYAVWMIPLLILFAVVTVRSELMFKRKVAKYSFTIDCLGVRQCEVDRDYHLGFEEIVCWGFVNNNIRFWKRSGSPQQMCMYFSKSTSYTEKDLRNVLKSIEAKKYMHANTDEIIIFGFKENMVDEILYNKMVQFISEHCKVEPTNYIEQETEF